MKIIILKGRELDSSSEKLNKLEAMDNTTQSIVTAMIAGLDS